MTTVYIYCRFSHIESSKGMSERDQIDRCLAYHTYKFPTLPLYRGTNPDQPFEECIDRAVSAYSIEFRKRKAGRFIDDHLKKGDHLIVAYFDRAFRDASDALSLHKEWNHRGVGLHILNLGVDTSTPLGFAAFGMAAIMAQTMSMQLSERIMNNNATRKRYDLTVGRRSKILPGFHAVRIRNKDLGTDTHQVLFDPAQIPLLKRYYELWHSGLTELQIEKLLVEENQAARGAKIVPYAFADEEDKVSSHRVKRAALVWQKIQEDGYLESKSYISYTEVQEWVRERTEKRRKKV